jgi:hypothetical protein
MRQCYGMLTLSFTPTTASICRWKLGHSIGHSEHFATSSDQEKDEYGVLLRGVVQQLFLAKKNNAGLHVLVLSFISGFHPTPKTRAFKAALEGVHLVLEFQRRTVSLRRLKVLSRRRVTTSRDTAL